MSLPLPPRSVSLPAPLPSEAPYPRRDHRVFLVARLKPVFRASHFARDIEHTACGKSVTIDYDRERISGKWGAGENVELVEASLHNFLRSQNSLLRQKYF